MKKPNFLAWLEIPDCEFNDHFIEAKIRLDSLGGYAAAGLLFHIRDDEAYYLALVSSKGYLRVDVVKDNSPKTLVAWTEISGFDGTNINLNILTYGAYLIFIVNGKWVAETSDHSIEGGRIGFALTCYESGAGKNENSRNEYSCNEYSCKAMLDCLSVDARLKTIEDSYKKWNDDSNINAESRLRLAETFAVMGDAVKSLEQINRAWKKRDETISSVSISYTAVRTKKELLLAARMSLLLEQYNEAEEYIDSLLEQWLDSAEGKEAVKEKIKILNKLGKFGELKKFLLKHSNTVKKDIDYYALLARSYFELKEYKNSAKTWDKAFDLNRENGVYAANAAASLELAGKNDEALARYIEAANIFLKQDNVQELAAVMPKLSILGSKNWEARVLAGKWFYSIKDYSRSEAEFTAANKLRCAIKPRPAADPAHYYLWGMVLSLKGKNKEAVNLLERAVKLAPDYGLFRFKLAEIKILGGSKDKTLGEEFKIALEDIGEDPDGTMTTLAGNLLLKAGDKKNAKYFLDKKQG